MTALLLAAALAAQADLPVRTEKVFLPRRALPGDTNMRPLEPIDTAAWVWHPESNGDAARIAAGRSANRGVNVQAFPVAWTHPVFLRFRKRFAVTDASRPVRVHLSADERFELQCDGTRVARGPDRGDPNHWSFATYDLKLAAGDHTLEAVVCWLGPYSPWAQTSWRGGFILKAEGPYDAALTTGKAEWEVAELPGATLTPPTVGPFATGAQFDMAGCGPSWQTGPFTKAIVVREPVRATVYGLSAPGWHLYPSTLPDQLSRRVTPGRVVAVAPSADPALAFTAQHAAAPERAAWQALVSDGRPLTLPTNTSVTALWDLGDYYCAYPQLALDGGSGSRIVWSWAEALIDTQKHKGNRSAFEGKSLPGVDDTARPDGRAGASFAPFWWRSGRWCALRITTGDTPLTLRSLALEETRYPVSGDDAFTCDDPRVAGIRALALRGLQMCMHETYVDCPYYEQQMYPGDTRVQMLVNHVISADPRLTLRAIDLFDYSRRDSGLIGMNYPTWGTQDSVTYSLIWPLMLRDCLAWRRCDPAWLKAKALGLRSLLSGVAYYENADGLIANLPGWSFIDWVPSWKTGNAPDGSALNAPNNLFYLHALLASAEIEEALGEPLLARRCRDKAATVSAALQKTFWNEARGLLADDTRQSLFSEHAQCLMLLADALPTDRAKRAYEGLTTAKDLARCTVYFSHYLFETYFKFGRADLFLDRLSLWQEYVNLGLCTPMEEPGESRSDCHAWGAHPITFMHTGLAGVRPAASGFTRVRIAPCPGPLKRIASKTPHPDGLIETDLTFDGKGGVTGTVTLPPGLTGEFVWNGAATPLKPGLQGLKP
jgi:hypothetical protein